MSGKKKNFKELEKNDDLVLSKDILNDSDDEINWWEIANDSGPHDYGNDDYYDENDRYDEYDTNDQDWVNNWIKSN